MSVNSVRYVKEPFYHDRSVPTHWTESPQIVLSKFFWQIENNSPEIEPTYELILDKYKNSRLITPEGIKNTLDTQLKKWIKNPIENSKQIRVLTTYMNEKEEGLLKTDLSVVCQIGQFLQEGQPLSCGSDTLKKAQNDAQKFMLSLNVNEREDYSSFIDPIINYRGSADYDFKTVLKYIMETLTKQYNPQKAVYLSEFYKDFDKDVNESLQHPFLIELLNLIKDMPNEDKFKGMASLCSFLQTKKWETELSNLCLIAATLHLKKPLSSLTQTDTFKRGVTLDQSIFESQRQLAKEYKEPEVKALLKVIIDYKWPKNIEEMKV